TLPNVTLKIVPFANGGHAAAGGPFNILRFTGAQLPDVVYPEQLASAVYLDNPEETDKNMVVMDRLCVAAAPASETARFLGTIMKNVACARRPGARSPGPAARLRPAPPFRCAAVPVPAVPYRASAHPCPA